MKSFFSLLFSFLKVGFIGFGGGSALIPVIEDEIVAKKKLLKEEDYNNHVIVSNITPGTLPVKLAAAAGRKVYGIPGMLGATIMMSLPGVAITVLLVSLLSQLGDNVVTQIKFASVGISVFIIMLLVNYIKKVLAECRQTNTLTAGWIIMLLTFFLTGGKEINNILGLNRAPIFDISTVNLLLLAFFIIFFTGGKLNLVKGGIAGIVGILFILCSGKARIVENDMVFLAVKIGMLALSCYGIVRNLAGSRGGKIDSVNNKEKPGLKGFLAEELAWVVYLALMAVPAAFIIGNIYNYLSQGLISTVISFGGGEAYISIAETVFVSGGFIPSEVFYGQVLPVANALPGPILSKVLAAIGYYIAYNATQSVGAGLILANVGYAASLAASCMVFSSVFFIYSRFESLELFQTLKKWILPIVSGLLLTTILSMLYENINIIMEHNGTVLAGLAVCLVIFCLLMLLHKKYRLHDIILILISGAVSLVICNIFALN